MSPGPSREASFRVSSTVPPCSTATASTRARPRHGSGRVPARLQPHETPEHPFAIGLRDTRALVTHHDPPPGAARGRRHHARLDDHPPLTVPQGVVDEVRQGLEEEVSVAGHGERVRFADEHQLPALLVRVRLVELDRIAREGPEVRRRETLAGRPGLHARDPEQGREGGEEAIGLADRGFHRVGRAFAELAAVAQLFQAGAKAGERGLDDRARCRRSPAGSRP